MNCGDIEENPGVLDQCYSKNNFVTNTVLGVRNSGVPLEAIGCVNLIELMLEEVVTVFFRAVSHQMYGNPDNQFHVRSLGIQNLMHNPEQFIESNTDYSWQGYLNNMSCQGTWTDAIIIQAVANCLNLSKLPSNTSPLPPGANCEICLLLTECYQSQKFKSV